MRVPSATYRLQFNSEFTFGHARALVPYLHALGITDVYASPLAQARRGSTHGYDIIDPTRLNPELGAVGDFEGFVSELKARRMGLVLDIVPNHMAADPENPWWADVLTHGADSRYARFFDIDWRAGAGKVILPILGRPYQETLDAGELSLVQDERGPCLRYFDTSLPLNPAAWTQMIETRGEELDRLSDDPAWLAALLQEQHYRLVYWRTGQREMNYRRFFDITGLAGVRVEDADVFDASHALYLRLAREGSVTGLRIDHVDGLRDPSGYLERLQRALPGSGADAFYVVVEKITTGDEALPEEWPTAGTTGYDFLNMVNGLFVDPDGLEVLTAAYRGSAAVDGSLADVAYEKKKLVAGALFERELEALATSLVEISTTIGASMGTNELRKALLEVSACFPVYRSYTRGFGVREEDRRNIEQALAEAARRGAQADRGALETLERVLLLDVPEPSREACLDFVMRWQQFTGPLTAKGLEDTALYNYNALVSLNDVGADPFASGAVDVETFHRRNGQRRTHTPHTLNATATHDTKRGEDARSRISAISELAPEWTAALERWSNWNAPKKGNMKGRPVPDVNEDWLIYQTLAGIWPPDGVVRPELVERFKAYLLKAAREAKAHTNWRAPDESYERKLTDFAAAILGDEDGPFLADFRGIERRTAFAGMVNSLSQLVLKICSPGVPDIYRGTELWDLTLVDPDNRQPVDFRTRADALRHVEQANMEELLDQWRDGRIKLYVTRALLKHRAARSELFARGAYVPLRAGGQRRRHLVSFARRLEDQWSLAVVPRLAAALAPAGTLPVGHEVWADTWLTLPDSAPAIWRNVLTDDKVAAKEGRLSASGILARTPVAVLSGET